ncbi:SMP-30/gluconolactonase/LRE family protein [Martelella soudanensis]|uniref:SMP-30/gluconolactonase/LRE family protein n=1 Tax=unclassified Martelella TaxID=2629616 RepID=UPI0015DDD9FD|nr:MULTISPECIES: SMP-30/gluconolactonase/LRE family protein [unclassified Martelella]
MKLELGNTELVANTNDIIGEVPLWHAEQSKLYWIDVFKPAFHIYDPIEDNVRSWTPPEKLGGYSLYRDGSVLISGRSGLTRWWPETDKHELIAPIESDRPENILNDGRTDAMGRFLTAGMNKQLETASGRLWSYDCKSEPRVLQDGDITLPNSICWSPDWTTLYFGETTSNVIYSYDYDLESGAISNRRIFADTRDLPGECDGSIVDFEGFLWNARINGSCIARFDPDGRLDCLIDLPVSKPAHLTFGGEDLSTLFITTATFRMSEEIREREPWSGGLLKLQTNTRGVREPFLVV